MITVRQSKGDEKREGRDSTEGILHLSWCLPNFVPESLKLLSRSLEKKLESQLHLLCENTSRKSERTWRKDTFKGALQRITVSGKNNSEGE